MKALKLESSTNDGRFKEMNQESMTDAKKILKIMDISSLPDPVIFQILSRVPAKTVFNCMSVTKSWLSMVKDPFFVKQHFSRALVCPLLVLDGRSLEYKLDHIVMHLVEGKSVGDFDPEFGKSKLNSRIEICYGMEGRGDQGFGFYPQLNQKVTSCEGMICCARSPKHDGGEDHVIVCNPITREYVTVNPFQYVNNEGECLVVLIGLGFSRVDRKFKLLRIIIDESDTIPLSRWLEVLVIGSKDWRRIDIEPSTPEIDFLRNVFEVVYVNGAIYWRYDGDPSICCFEFDSNIFLVVPLPDMNEVALETNSFVTKNMSMGVLGSSLCVSLVCPNDGHVELWIRQKTGRTAYWRQILKIETPATAMDHNGRLWMRGHYKAIKYLECGKVLLHDWRDTFLIYDPVTKSDKMFRVLDHSYLKTGTCLSLQVVPHVPSLVSLKDALNIEDDSLMVLKGYLRTSNSGTVIGSGGTSRSQGQAPGR